jgi:predicted ABC-type transport system involved in lysophospholipase L1 biosynthesis ATPase subunit
MILRANQIEKMYMMRQAELHILRGADLVVEAAESVAVIGVSGAGKSTLLHILGGLDKPDRGTVQFEGQDLYALPSWKRTRLRARHIGFVFQSYHLLPEMDVLGNVMLAGMALGRRPGDPQLKERAATLLDAVGLSARCTHHPMELSGGEQQRVALARALMNAPQLVLADEPTGNLDSGTGAQVLDHLFALTSRAGHALVLVTHDRQTASRCDRVLKLDNGRLVPG